MYEFVRKKNCIPATPSTATYLQSVLEELVHPRHLGGNTEVDRAVTNLDDEAAADIWVHL